MCLAIPGRILSVDECGPLTRAGRVDFSGAVRSVNLCCVPEAQAGSFVLVHVGMAISVIDEDEARELLAAIARIEDPGESVPPAEPLAAAPLPGGGP